MNQKNCVYSLLLAAALVAVPVQAVDDHLVLCEVVVTPTSDEFIEITNPTGAAVSLDNYYLSDDEDYALLPGASGSGPAPSIAASDFIAQFPGGSSIAPMGVVVIAFDGAAFETTFGTKADFEIKGTDPATPDMIATNVGGSAGLTNSGENAVLFFWDGTSDLVQDVDMLNIGTPSSTNDIADKTGIGVDGPDGDTTATVYGTDLFTMPQQASDPGFGFSTKRIFFEGASESTGGGNGITGDDETTEDISFTWDDASSAPDPGVCNAASFSVSFVINEINADPDATAGDANGDGTVSTTQDEFVEIVNTSGVAVDISGWTLSDAVSVRHTFPAGTVVPNGCPVLVFAGGTPTGAFGGAVVQTSSTGILSFNNGGDSVILNDGSSDVVTASYGGEGGANQSLTLDPDIIGAEPRVQHTVATGSAGTLFSPGTQIDGTAFAGCPTPPDPTADWVINEIHADPDATAGDANGDGTVNTSQDEFVEIFNNTGAAADISGWTISDAVGVRHTFPAGTVVPDQCTVVVFGAGGPVGGFGGSEVQTSSSGQLGFNNSGDTVTLNDGVVDVVAVSYGSEGGDNQSLTRDPDITGEFVKHAGATGSAGALYSPGTPIDGSQFSGCPLPPSGLVINEIHADPDATSGDANGDGSVSTTQDEFVEIVNDSGAPKDISGWTLADGFSVRHTFPAGTVIPDGCSVVVFSGGTPTGTFGNSLVQTASGGSLGLNNGGDSVTLNDGVSDIETATYGSEGGDNQSLTLDPDITGTLPYVKHTVATGSGGTLFSPGTQVDGTAFPGCSAPPSVLEIFEIQGSGDASPFDGAVVTSEDNIVTAVGTDRFFMQTPDTRDDADANTSNGILVFTGTAPTVSVGDQVDVTGEVDEFFGLTELTSVSSVTIDSSGNALPVIVDFDAFTPSDLPVFPADLERFEGMRVRASTGTTSAPTDRFGDTCMVAGGGRLFREPGIEFPGLPGLPVWDGNPEGFEINPDGLGGMDELFTAGTALSTEGVLSFSFGDYQILPTALTIGAAPPLPQGVRARNAGEFTVATQNMFRLFNDVDNGMGDPVPTPAEYADRLDKFSRQVREVLGAPDILAVQEVENLDTLLDLAVKIATDDPSVVYTPVLVEGNDVGGIDVGYMVRDTVQILGSEQIGATEILTFDGSLLNDRPPLVLEARYVGDGSFSFDVTLVVVHQRSLGGIDDASDGPRVRQKRHEQAVFVSEWIGDRQDADPSERILVLGDFNAYEFTDGYVDVLGQIIGDPADASEALIPGTDEVEPNFTNQVLSLPAEERYSFVFGCNAQVLDHIVTSQSLNPAVVEVAYGRSNADAPDDLVDVPGTALRSSDHDGLVMYVDAGASCPCFAENDLFREFIEGTLDVASTLDCRDDANNTGLLYLLANGDTVGAASGTRGSRPNQCGTQNLTTGETNFMLITPEEDATCRNLLRAACPI